MLQEKPSALERELTVFWLFSIVVGHFALQDPDPDPAEQNQCGHADRIRNTGSNSTKVKELSFFCSSPKSRSILQKINVQQTFRW
jgi:hypothetical protein